MSYTSDREIEISRELRENQIPVVGCSQCGGDFPKPRNALYATGFSHCEDHRPLRTVLETAISAAEARADALEQSLAHCDDRRIAAELDAKDERALRLAAERHMQAREDAYVLASEALKKAEAARDALAKASLEGELRAQMAEWQPIETAPKGSGKDGPHDVRHPDYIEPPRILVALEDRGLAIVYWDWYYAEGGNGFIDGRAWVDATSGELLCNLGPEPTHWMPLPDPPSADPQEG